MVLDVIPLGWPPSRGFYQVMGKSHFRDHQHQKKVSRMFTSLVKWVQIQICWHKIINKVLEEGVVTTYCNYIVNETCQGLLSS
jgi:hypothetical protein